MGIKVWLGLSNEESSGGTVEDGAMDSNSSKGSSNGQKVLGTDESQELDEDQQAEPGEHGIDEDSSESGKSVEELLSGDLGEEPVEEQEETGDTGEENEEEGSDEKSEGGKESLAPDTFRAYTRDRGGQDEEIDDTLMELPDACVTESESPDPDASAEEMLPEALPGWEFQKTDRYRWQMDNAEDYVNATYRDPQKRLYMFHISKWKPRHVKYALDELYRFWEPEPFDIWVARGQFVFAIKIASGTVENAYTLLMAAPALSKSYLQTNDEEVSQ